VESNLEQQTPKLPKINVTNVSSAVFGKEGSALGKESKIGKLARIVRTTRIKVNTIEKILPEHQEVIGSTAKKAFINAKKITSIKNILKNQKSKIGEKLPGSNKDNKDNFNKTLVETNRILVEIQKQLASDFAMQVAEQKGDEQKEKKERSREKLRAEESALEKSRKKIGAALAKTTEKVLSPFKGIFDQVKEFVMTVGTGIVVNAAFDWLSQEENRQKLVNAFEFIKDNWRWILGVTAGLIAFGPIVSVVSSIVSLASILLTIGAFVASILGAPAFLTLLGIIAAAGGVALLADFIRTNAAGGSGFRVAYDRARTLLTDDQRFNEDGQLLDQYGKVVKKRFTPAYATQGKVETVTYEMLKNGFLNNQYTAEDLRKEFKVSQKDMDRYEPFNNIFNDIRQFKKLKDAERNAVEKSIPKSAGANFPGFRRRNEQEEAQYNLRIAEIEKNYNTRVLELPGLPPAPGRRMGGPVTSGKPYLVGEAGPELFMPRIDGSIIDNTRTEKIYQVLASGKRGKIRTITLPPEIIEGAKAQTQMPLSIGEATKEPRISSTNPMDGSRAATSGIYGIMV